VTPSFDFTSGPFTCTDKWAGSAIGGIVYQMTNVPKQARLKCVMAVPPDLNFALVPNVEYYSFKLNLNSTKTVGTGACSGCSVPVCLVLNSIEVNRQVPSVDELVTNPATRAFATWQGGIPNCYAATPAKRSTWGAVKSLYR
jgi:hypothetical protein